MQLLVVICKLYYQKLHLKYLCNLIRYWLQAPWEWHDSVETFRCMIICVIIVHLLVIVQNTKIRNLWFFVFHHISEEASFHVSLGDVQISRWFATSCFALSLLCLRRYIGMRFFLYLRAKYGTECSMWFDTQTYRIFRV